MKYIDILKKQLPQFDLKETKDGNIHGVVKIYLPEIRFMKDRYRRGPIYLYISNPLYKGTDHSFRYAICYQKTKFTGYRKRNGFEVEENKIYCSGKTLSQVTKKLVSEIKKAPFVYS